ncbi:unnamed protein product, partial [Ectocarpus sp. 8 AP-2014]
PQQPRRSQDRVGRHPGVGVVQRPTAENGGRRRWRLRRWRGRDVAFQLIAQGIPRGYTSGARSAASASVSAGVTTDGSSAAVAAAAAVAVCDTPSGGGMHRVEPGEQNRERSAQLLSDAGLASVATAAE